MNFIGHGIKVLDIKKIVNSFADVLLESFVLSI